MLKLFKEARAKEVKGRHQKTYEALFASPVPSNIRWKAIEALLRHLGAHIEERSGSRVAVELARKNNPAQKSRRIFHRPHPSPNTDKGAVVSVRNFLTECGY